MDNNLLLMSKTSLLNRPISLINLLFKIKLDLYLRMSNGQLCSAFGLTKSPEFNYKFYFSIQFGFWPRMSDISILGHLSSYNSHIRLTYYNFVYMKSQTCHFIFSFYKIFNSFIEILSGPSVKVLAKFLSIHSSYNLLNIRNL